MSIKDRLEKLGLDPALAWSIFVGFVVAVVWLANLQTAVARHEEKLHGIEEMRQDIKWIKMRLGGPQL